MASFYGNITTATRSAFVFDRIYNTRYEMDSAANSDGVYLGRFVMVNYGNPPICGYYYSGNFFADGNNTVFMPPQDGRLYQNIAQLNTEYSFYYYGGELGAGYHNTPYKEPYGERYNIDVKQYGRGYGASIWMKSVKQETGNYEYVLVADLDPKVPQMHLVADPPSGVPHAPYFDGNSTNLDYYMHVQAAYGNRINEAKDAEHSDEQVIVPESRWNEYTYSWEYNDRTVNGDIYYNRAGFDKFKRAYDTDTQNTINYVLSNSGQKYYGQLNGVEPKNGVEAKDQYLWYIRLPALGNMVCEIWDYMFTSNRMTEILRETGENIDKSTVDTESVLGLTNSMRCYMGYIDKMPEAAKANGNGMLLEATAAGGTLPYLRKIVYTDTVQSGNTKLRHYYYPTYYSKWVQDSNGTYYKAGDGSYRLANKAALPASTVYYRREPGYGGDGKNLPHVQFKELYRNDTTKIGSGLAAIAAAADSETPTTIYSALATINRLIGVTLDIADSRDDRTVVGLMNQMKDIIANIDTQLQPNAIVVTDANGRITTLGANSADLVK